jgi:hypothetical protein
MQPSSLTEQPNTLTRQAVESMRQQGITHFVGLDLSGLDLSYMNFSQCNLGGVNLSKVNLRCTILLGVNLSRANLSGDDLSGVYLDGANLSWANLSKANLSGANLSKANLREANLSGANLSRAKFNQTQVWQSRGLDVGKLTPKQREGLRYEIMPMPDIKVIQHFTSNRFSLFVAVQNAVLTDIQVITGTADDQTSHSLPNDNKSNNAEQVNEDSEPKRIMLIV